MGAVSLVRSCWDREHELDCYSEPVDHCRNHAARNFNADAERHS